ncbi:AHH domain-containing protein [Archangium violaceum]|uniref:AHH domain-containing protein n=1 Tax=Archangium violaceum TaxID=83451 RepID=UPI0013635547|nr:AHH domain-containing protein [Archangium violaceum]
MGGGYEPSANEIALEKNVLYFQRTQKALGIEPATTTIYFANGKSREPTVRYLDEDGEERFKVPKIPNLIGPSTVDSFKDWLARSLSQDVQRPVFIYVTAHGGQNDDNSDNNYLALWGGDKMYVRYFAKALDQFPDDTPVVTMMAQCFSGSFGNFIYQGGVPTRGVSHKNRCGFFATVKSRTSVGCTAEVDESDYEDYSSSFFAGLSGYDRTGQPVASADYDQDGRVSYTEAHAFAKVDEETSDWPVSTSELWLQRQAEELDQEFFASFPITELQQLARPEQRHVVESLVRHLGFVPTRSWLQNQSRGQRAQTTEVQHAYAERLRMELINIGMEARIRKQGNPRRLEVLKRLLECEGGSWTAQPTVATRPGATTRPSTPSICSSGETEDGNEPHHIATVALKASTYANGPWTPRFKQLFEQAGMNLEDPANLIYLRAHTAPHPEKYHQEIFQRMRETLKGCGDLETCRGVLRMELRLLASEICTPGTALNGLVTR